MDATKVQIKLYAQKNTEQSLEPYIPLFHQWIQKDAVGEMIFDVADYTHVPRGIGVLLVGHGSDYALDQGEDRPGLLYSRKRDLPAGAALVQDALSRVLEAAALVDATPAFSGPHGFQTKELLFRFPDRLHLRNDEVGFERARPAVESALGALLPDQSYTLAREGEAREPLTIRATS